MAAAMRLTLAALVVCAAFAAPAAGRQLKQTGNNLDFPGCSFLSDSEIFQNPDFSSLAAALQASGLNETLSNLTGYHTLFAPTNEAFAEFLAAANITAEDALSSNLNEIVLASHVVPGVVPGELLVSNLFKILSLHSLPLTGCCSLLTLQSTVALFQCNCSYVIVKSEGFLSGVSCAE